jgi:hypothetical protein
MKKYTVKNTSISELKLFIKREELPKIANAHNHLY